MVMRSVAGKSRLPTRVALLVSICGLASVIGTDDLVSLDDGAGWQAARDSLTSQLEVAAAARDAMLAQRNEANTALADQRSGNIKLKSDQEQQFTDLAERHRDEIDELNENFATAMGMCQPRLHRVRQAKLAAQKWQDKIELIRATIEKLDGRVAELTSAIPILKQKEAAAADAVPDTVSPMEEAQTTAHAAHAALSAATNANASTLPALRDAKKAADLAFVAALTTHQTAAQDAEWATRHRQEVQHTKRERGGQVTAVGFRQKNRWRQTLQPPRRSPQASCPRCSRQRSHQSLSSRQQGLHQLQEDRCSDQEKLT